MSLIAKNRKIACRNSAVRKHSLRLAVEPSLMDTLGENDALNQLVVTKVVDQIKATLGMLVSSVGE